MSNWEYIPSNEHHGAYVVDELNQTVCDFYVMSHPSERSVRNGGRSKPVPFGPYADERARLTGQAPAMLGALKQAAEWFREYEAIHLAKGGAADDKAARNRERAEQLEAVIAAAEGQE